MIGSRNIVSLFWILSASCLEAINMRHVYSTTTCFQAIPEDNSGNSRSLRAVVGGNLFGGLFAKKMCRKTGDGVYNTISTSRFRFRANTSPGDMTGACSGMCNDLCPTSCYGSFKVDGSTCSCAAPKCGGNAVCNASKTCECKANFDGNGLICCDTFSGFAFSSAGCVFRAVASPTAAGSPTAPSVPGAPSVPVATPPGPPNPAPVAPAPRAPTLGRIDLLPPKLLDFVALSPTSVDVSTANAKMEFEITAIDEKSGIRKIEVYGYTAFRGVYYNKTLESPFFGKFVHKFTLPFSQYVAGGIGVIGLAVQDFTGNSITYDAEELAALGLPYDYEVINTKNETLAPELLSLGPMVSPFVLNASSQVVADSVFLFQATVRDDFSGVRGISMRFRASFNELYAGANLPDVVDDYDNIDFPIAGSPLTLNVTFYFDPRNSNQVGSYRLYSVTVQDFSNKFTEYNETTLVALGYARNITIVR